ncbi:MAG: hypothetical protein JWM96_1194 [Alphaproteobacteria bacterium]|nr:hypothetical protein [Alphaproteobacteria bacterium]
MSRSQAKAVAKTSPVLYWLAFGILVLAIYWLCGMTLASAQSPTITNASGLRDVTRNIGTSARPYPRLVAMLGYVCGTFFAISGLLKLKDWTNDSERNSIMPGLIRIVVSALLITFPHIFVLVNTTFWGRNSQGNTLSTTAQMPQTDFRAFPCTKKSKNCQ